jgi:HPt (histidine-containing phosphotransfer) domain-containing protein
MSHEIRTHLNTILGTVKLLQRTELTDLQRNYLNRVHNAGESLQAILNDIPQLGAHPLPVSPLITNNNRVFNPENLLRYVKGNDQRYNAIVQMIRNTVERGTLPLDEAIAALHDGNIESAHRIFHTIKGSMGNLGAGKIWEVAHRLEEAVTATAHLSDISPLLTEMRQAIEEMLPLAQRWLDTQSGAPDEKTGDMNPMDWQNNLEQLQELLAQTDMHAFDIYETLRSGLSRHLPPDAYQQLDHAVQNLRFTQAEHILRENIIR